LNESLETGEELTEEKAEEVAEQYVKIADLDGNGTISLDEFKTFMQKLEGASEDCEELFNSFDEDKDGEITASEFA